MRACLKSFLSQVWQGDERTGLIGVRSMDWKVEDGGEIVSMLGSVCVFGCGQCVLDVFSRDEWGLYEPSSCSKYARFAFIHVTIGQTSPQLDHSSQLSESPTLFPWHGT